MATSVSESSGDASEASSTPGSASAAAAAVAPSAARAPRRAGRQLAVRELDSEGSTDPDGGMACSTLERKRTRGLVRNPGTGESADPSQTGMLAFVHQQQPNPSAVSNAQVPPPASVTNAIPAPTLGHAH